MQFFIEAFGQFGSFLIRYFDNGWCIGLYALAFIFLMIGNQIFRRKIGYGLLIIMLLFACKPLYSIIWEKIFGNTFWRAFWLLNVEFVFAFAIIDLVRKSNQKALKFGIMLCGIVLLIFSGTFMYQEGVFKKADNPYKLDQNSIDIAQYLLSIDAHPYALCSLDVAMQIRQYSDDIQLLYGRDAVGYSLPISDENVKEVSRQIEKEKRPDFAFITNVCKQYGVRYMVIRKKKNQDELIENGWRQIAVFDKKIIYLLN